MCASPLWSADIKLPGEAASASRARAFVRGGLASHDLDYLVDDATLVVSELATNAVLHAHSPFQVSLHGFERTVLLDVKDGSQEQPHQRPARAGAVHGRGLLIVSTLTSDWGVEPSTNGGNSVWAEFDRR